MTLVRQMTEIDESPTMPDIQDAYEKHLLTMNRYLTAKTGPQLELIKLLISRHISIVESHNVNLWNAKRHASYVSSGALCTLLWFMSNYSETASCVFFLVGSVLVAFIESLILNFGIPSHATDGRILELVAILDL